MSRRITLPDTVDRGAMLQETVRAYMHGALPSALLGRIEAGLAAFLDETSGDMNTEDHAFVSELHDLVEQLRVEWRRTEDEKYLPKVQP